MSGRFHGVVGMNVLIGGLINQTPVRPSKGGVRGNAPLLTDNQILELRALSQYAGWGCDRLMARYGVDKDMIWRVVEGVTRSRLVASPRHLPTGVTAK